MLSIPRRHTKVLYTVVLAFFTFSLLENDLGLLRFGHIHISAFHHWICIVFVSEKAFYGRIKKRKIVWDLV